MSYEYEQDMNGNGLHINDWGGSDVTVRVTFERGNYVAVYLPADERREAAQSVAGDDYRVAPRGLTVGDLVQIARDAGVKLDMDVQESEPTDSETVTVSWHDTVLIGPAIHAAKMLADSEDGGGITISEDGEALARLPLPKRRGTRLNLARLITPDGWTIVPSESATSAAAMQEDLRAILDALGLSTASRPYSPHECVQRDVLPAIERLQRTANMPTWERELLANHARSDHRPEPVSHFDVRPGDRVEVEHAGPPLWRWEAVADNAADEDGLWLSFHPGRTLLVPHDATVRILHPAEPEVDEAAVDALERAFSRVGIYLSRETKRQLIRDHGVRVEVPDER